MPAVKEKLILETEVKGSKDSASKLALIDKQLNKIGLSTKGLLAAGGLAALGVALKEFGQASIQAAARFEQSEVAFTTMLGSAEAAQALLRELAQLAKTTPFTLQGIEMNAKQLLAMGVSAERLMPTIKALGDVSAGLSVPLERLALNFGQVAAQGKLTGRELRDFAIAGVPLLEELSKMLGVSKAMIQDMVSAGEIGFDEVEQAFINMTSEGGKFNDLMKAQSKTFNGMVSNLQDSIELLLRDTGKDFLDFGKAMVQILIDFVDEVPAIINKFKVAFRPLVEVAKDIGKTFNLLLNEVNKITEKLLGENMTLWEGALNTIALGINGLVSSLHTLAKLAVEIAPEFAPKKFIGRMGDAVAENSRQINEMEGAWNKFKGLVGGTFDVMKTGLVGFSESTNQEIDKILNEYEVNLVESWDAIVNGNKDSAALSSRAWAEFAKELDANLKSFGDSADGSSEKAKKAMEKQAAALIKLTTEYRKSKEVIKKELEDLNKEHEKNLSEINEKISKTKDELLELEQAFAESQTEEAEGFASEYIAQQERIKDIEEDIQSERDARRRADGINEKNEVQARINRLESQLKKEKKSLEDADLFLKDLRESEKEFAIQIENDIAEAKERARQTDFTNFLNDFEARRIEQKKEFEAEQIRLNEKLEAFKEELRKENLAHKLAQGRIEARMNLLNDHYKNVMERNTLITKQELDKQITFFNRLEQAAKNAMAAASLAMSGGGTGNIRFAGGRANGGPVASGRTYLVGERGPELFTPSGSGKIVPNGGGGIVVNVSGIFGSDAAEEIGNMIAHKLGIHVSV